MPRGLTRLPNLLVAAALAAVLAASGCADEAAAARVGDATLSNEDLMDEVAMLHDNEALWQGVGQSSDVLEGEAEGSFSQDFVAGVLQQRVTFMLVDQLFEDEGGEITAEYRQAAQDELERQFGEAFAEFPQRYQDDLVEDYAHLVSLQDQLGSQGFNDAIVALIEDTEVDISSKYGSWDAEIFANSPDQLAVVPPEGATPAPQADDDGGR